MIRGITFDKQLLKSFDHAHEVNFYFQGDMGVTKGCVPSVNVSNDIAITDGYFLVNGRLINILGGEVVDVPVVPSGTLYSVLVFEIDLTKVNTKEVFNQGYFKILSNASAYPTPVTEDLDNGGTLHQFEFARFENTVGGVVNFSDTRVILDMDKYATKSELDLKADVVTYTATIPSASWTGASAPFSKAVTVTGLLTTDNPIVDIVLSGTYATDQAMVVNWALIYRGVVSADTITFYATAVPSADISIQVKVVR